MASTDETISVARELGDALLAASLPQADHRTAWLGWIHPMHGAIRVGVVSNDLLSGASGIAIFFAALYRATGLEHYADASWRTLAGPTQELLELEDRLGEQRVGSVVAGAFLGIGGIVFSSALCSKLLDDPAPSQAARRFVASFPSSLAVTQPSHPVMAGVLGYACAAARSWVPDPGTLTWISLSTLDADGVQALGDAPTRRSRYIDGLPGRTWAKLTTLALLARFDDEAARRLDQYESELSDLQRAKQTFGDRLGGLALSHVKHAAAVGDASWRSTSGPTSIHELIDELEGRLCAAELVDLDANAPAVQFVVDEILRRRRLNGGVFGEYGIADAMYPSAIYGTAGVGCLLLRAAGVEVPSLRLLGPVRWPNVP